MLGMAGTIMQNIHNLGSYVFKTQGSIKHDGEWPNKLGSQYYLNAILK
jgi:hypothetical protein